MLLPCPRYSPLFLCTPFLIIHIAVQLATKLTVYTDTAAGFHAASDMLKAGIPVLFKDT